MWSYTVKKVLKGFCNTRISQGARFLKEEAMLISKMLGLFFRHLAQRWVDFNSIYLVANKVYHTFWLSTGPEILHPFHSILKRISFGDIVNHQSSYCSSIVSASDRLVSLLPS
jgi:hypothetical protein